MRVVEIFLSIHVFWELKVSSFWCSKGSLWTVWLSRWRLYHLLKLQGTTCSRIHCHIPEDLIINNTAIRTSYVAEIFSDCILDDETYLQTW